ncbi:MAG: thiolase family protein [Proteobacteria bacterium]|nr:thiolase family protein [Pseudomonadota bacterium]TDJ38096.1 MAG: thiolase family protein [Gammaproteobacteria bacterium]
MFDQVEIPYGCYWSTPFVRWQGALQHLHAIKFAAHVARRELDKRNIDPRIFDAGVLGISVYQHQSFYGTPWFMGLLGAPQAPGPTLSQVCASGVRAPILASMEIASGLAQTVLAATTDRCSNGPHTYYPAAKAPGGTGVAEDVVIDSFQCDPLGGHSMLQTAENVAAKHSISTAEQHEVVLRRFAQYEDALADDHAFQKRYMDLPFAVPDPRFRKTVEQIDGDQGVVASTADGLAKLKPVIEGGSVTFGGQTYPADGNAAMIITRRDQARELSADNAVRIRILSAGQTRAELGFMPEAPYGAAHAALERANLSFRDMDAIKTHNPFAVNDIILAREAGVSLEDMNNFGCSLIWGHPQAPTGMRLIIELIEELVMRGGGRGLFTGCAAGDTGMALVLSVDSG